MTLAIGFQTHTGRVREANQDSYAVLRGPELGHSLDGLFVVADGMGGVGGGEVASGIVAQSLPDAVHETLLNRNGAVNPPDTFSLLRDAMTRANATVWQHKAQHQELRRMGTTCVAAIVQGPNLTVGNVGDSRAYLLRQGRLRQLTEDHSQVWEEVRAGRMTREEARTTRYRNIITRGMGLAASVSPDVENVPLQDGDTVLLCSDGLTTEVPDAEVASLLAHTADPQEACRLLIEAALQNGGSDNITVVVLRYGTFVPSDVAVVDEDEETDPNQSWREASGRERGSARVQGIRSEEYEEEKPERFSPPPRRAASSPSSTNSLLLAGTLVAFVEAIALALAWTGTLPLRPQQKPAPPVAAATKPTDGPLAYDAPVLVYSGPLLDNYLQIEPSGNLLVVGEDGKLRRVSPQGKEQPVLNGGVTVPTPVVTDRRGNPIPAVRSPLVPHLAVDASGNRYQTRLIPKAIYKYNRDDTRVADNIGRGYLTAPAALTIAPNGDVYVIDAGQLKRLPARPDASRPNPSAPSSTRSPAPETTNP